MKKILWLSRHQMSGEQRADLGRVLLSDNLDIIQIDRTFQSGEEIAALAAENGADYICAVLPVHMLAEVLECTSTPVLQSVSERRQIGSSVNPDTGLTETRYGFCHAGWYAVESAAIRWM